MNELNKLTALMSDTDALAMRVVRARVEGLLSEHRAAIMLDKLADIADTLAEAARELEVYDEREAL